MENGLLCYQIYRIHLEPEVMHIWLEAMWSPLLQLGNQYKEAARQRQKQVPYYFPLYCRENVIISCCQSFHYSKIDDTGLYARQPTNEPNVSKAVHRPAKCDEPNI